MYNKNKKLLKIFYYQLRDRLDKKYKVGLQSGYTNWILITFGKGGQIRIRIDPYSEKSFDVFFGSVQKFKTLEISNYNKMEKQIIGFMLNE